MNTKVRRTVRLLPLLGLIFLSGCGLGPSDWGRSESGAEMEGQFGTEHVEVHGDGSGAFLSGHDRILQSPWGFRAAPEVDSASPTGVYGGDAGNHYADTIARWALNVQNVTSTVAVASGQVIILGLTIRPQASVHFGSIQREVRRRLMVQVPDFRYVYVTRNRAQVIELNRIADGLRSGVPIGHYHERIRNLMRTMAPVGMD